MHGGSLVRLQPALGDLDSLAFGEPCQRLSVDTVQTYGASGELRGPEGLRAAEKAEAEEHPLRP